MDHLVQQRRAPDGKSWNAPRCSARPGLDAGRCRGRSAAMPFFGSPMHHLAPAGARCCRWSPAGALVVLGPLLLAACGWLGAAPSPALGGSVVGCGHRRAGGLHQLHRPVGARSGADAAHRGCGCPPCSPLMGAGAAAPSTRRLSRSPRRKARDAVVALAGGLGVAWLAWVMLTRDHDSIAWYFLNHSAVAGAAAPKTWSM